MNNHFSQQTCSPYIKYFDQMLMLVKKRIESTHHRQINSKVKCAFYEQKQMYLKNMKSGFEFVI